MANTIKQLASFAVLNVNGGEIDQVYSYYQVIKSESRFNGSNSEWKFYLIGNDFDNSGYIKAQIDSLKMHGEPGLAFRGEYKIYVFIERIIPS